MKKTTILTIMTVALAFSLSLSAENIATEGLPSDPDTTVVYADSVNSWFDALSTKITRGTINALSFWVEVPKAMVQETIEAPVTGLYKGFWKGCGVGLVRAGSAIQDLATLGTIDDMYTVFDQQSFPYFVWQD